MSTHFRVRVGFEYENQGFWDENNLKIATNMLCNKSAICCHKDTQSQYPTILSAFYLDHSNGGELLLPCNRLFPPVIWGELPLFTFLMIRVASFHHSHARS